MSAIPLHDGELINGPPLLDVSTAVVTYQRHECAYVFKQSKVFVHFKIVEPSAYAGITVYRAYRVADIISGKGSKRRGKQTRFKLKHSSELFRQFVMLSGMRERPDRISLRRLKGCLIEVSLRTVKSDSRQRALPEVLRYTVVDEMLRIQAGALSE